MVLAPDSEPRSSSEPDDYRFDHPEEDPRQWGWHGRWGRGSRAGGFVVAAILALMATSTNYQWEYLITLWLLAAGIVVILVIDRHRRKYHWRR